MRPATRSTPTVGVEDTKERVSKAADLTHPYEYVLHNSCTSMLRHVYSYVGEEFVEGLECLDVRSVFVAPDVVQYEHHYRVQVVGVGSIDRIAPEVENKFIEMVVERNTTEAEVKYH